MKATLTLAALAAAGAVCPALAQASDVSVVVAEVSYADLSLSHADARAALERRVEAAIERVCPDRPAPGELRLMQAYDACHKSAWAGARRQLAALYNRPALAEAASGADGH